MARPKKEKLITSDPLQASSKRRIQSSTLVSESDAETKVEPQEPDEIPIEAIELPKDLPSPDEKPTSKQEDFLLIKKTLSGDKAGREAAYVRLLAKYQNQISNLILKIVHDKSEVEDLVQETFSKAFDSLGSFNHEYAFSTWLYRIATNSSIDFLRKRRLKTFSIDKPIESKDDEYSFELPDTRYEPDGDLMQAQRDKLVREAIAQLPEKYKTVITLRHLDEKSYEEIAKQLRQPIGTVKAHIFRAREMLNKYLRTRLRNF
jgi:RNA polymerase sigma factor (sigma-70 family)